MRLWVPGEIGSGVLRKWFQNCAADIVFHDIEGMGQQWRVHEAKEGVGSASFAEYAEVDHFEEACRFFTEHPLPWGVSS